MNGRFEIRRVWQRGLAPGRNPSSETEFIGLAPHLPFPLPAIHSQRQIITEGEAKSPHLQSLPFSYPPLCQLSPDGDLPDELCLNPRRD